MKNYSFALLQPSDFKNLMDYFSGLSESTLKCFGPHPFDETTIREICNRALLDSDETGRFILKDDSGKIIAYCLVKYGHINHDAERIKSFGVYLDAKTDSFFAPSIADSFQSKGLGKLILDEITALLLKKGIKKIILWGGVQALNAKAIRYYEKNGFTRVGEFEHNGLNYDMIKHL